MEFIFKFLKKYQDILIDLALLTIFYTFAYCLILFNRGLYWDDWTLFNQTNESIMSQFKQSAMVPTGWIHIFLLNIIGKTGIYKIGTFFLFLFSGYLFYFIAGDIDELKASKFLLAVLFSIMPVNFVRISMSVFNYTIYYLLFFVATWILIKTRKKSSNSVWSDCFVVTLYFISFYAQSLLGLYMLVLVYLYLTANVNFIKFIGKNILPIVLPIAFLIFKLFYIKPYGLYQGYNEISLESFVNLPITISKSLYYSVIDIFSIAGRGIAQQFGFFLLIFIFVYLLLKVCKREVGFDFLLSTKKILIWGFGLLFVSVLPYCLAGKIGSSYQYDSRHQLLLPLGLSLIFWVLLFQVSKEFNFSVNAKRCLVSLIIAFCIFLNFLIYLDLQRDWYKQAAIIEKVKSIPAIINGRTFIFNDYLGESFLFHRDYSFFEFNGMMRMAFKDQIRFGILEKHYNSMKYFETFLPYSNYNMTDYKIDFPQYRIDIKPFQFELNIANTFYLLWLERFDQQQLKFTLPTIVRLDVTPI